MKRLLAAAILGLGAGVAVSAQTLIVLDNFSGGGPSSIRSGTSWAGVGNVVQNLNGTMTVGNTALNDSGWGATGVTINATGMNFITIVAQNDGVNPAPSLVIGFSDGALHSQIFSVPTFSFATGASTTVQIPISSWGPVDPANITGWRIGGGTAGVVAFTMTFDDLSLTTSAIPEPATYAALTGVLALGFTIWRRRMGPARARSA